MTSSKTNPHGIKTPTTVDEFRNNLVHYFLTKDPLRKKGESGERNPNHRVLDIQVLDTSHGSPTYRDFQFPLTNLNSVSDLFSDVRTIGPEGEQLVPRVHPFVVQWVDLQDWSQQYIEVTPVSQTTEDLRKNGPKPTGPPHQIRMNYWDFEDNFLVPPHWEPWFEELYDGRPFISLIDDKWTEFFKMTLGEFYDLTPCSVGGMSDD